MMKFSEAYSIHEIGRKKKQEDYLWPKPGVSRDNDNCYIVCDGVGGSENGEIASRVVAEFIGQEMKQLKAEEISSEKVSSLLYSAQQELIRYAAENNLNTDMATTFSMCVIAGSKALIVWCGDSRIYHIRNGETLYKTQDHSLVGLMLRNGEITEDEAARHPRKNIILRAVSADNTPTEPESYWVDDLTENDYIMLCTDGLLENIREKDLHHILQPDHDPTQIINDIKLKCDNKTRDNYSMYLLKVSESQPVKSKRKLSSQQLYLIILLLVGIGVAVFINLKTKPTNNKPAADSQAPQAVKTQR